MEKIEEIDEAFETLSNVHLKMLKPGEDMYMAPWVYLIPRIQKGQPVLIDISEPIRKEMEKYRHHEDDRTPVLAMYNAVEIFSKQIKPMAVLFQHQGWQTRGVDADDNTRTKYHPDRERVMISQMAVMDMQGQLFKSYMQSDVIIHDEADRFIKYGDRTEYHMLASERPNDEGFSRFDEAAIWAKN